jgi:hypothetical protein
MLYSAVSPYDIWQLQTPNARGGGHLSTGLTICARSLSSVRSGCASYKSILVAAMIHVTDIVYGDPASRCCVFGRSTPRT